MSTLPSATLRVASIPFAARHGEIDHNVADVVAWIEQAARERVGLAVFPEACLTGGADARASADARRTRRAEITALAASVDSASVQAVADAVERTGVAAGVGLIERATNGDLYSSYVVCLPGGKRHVHRKLQRDGQRHIARGDCFTVFDAQAGWRLAVLIGGDNYLVENARMAALLGAALLIAPHAQTDASDEAGAWMRRALPARALDNGMFVVYSDAGDGAIVDPCGQVVAQRASGDDMIAADLDPASIGASPAHRWLEARRPDLYARLAHEPYSGAQLFEPRSANARGAVAVSVAVVKRTQARF
jgi:predicted amidohydrolase